MGTLAPHRLRIMEGPFRDPIIRDDRPVQGMRVMPGRPPSLCVVMGSSFRPALHSWPFRAGGSYPLLGPLTCDVIPLI